jgi:hypothetical protein
VNKKLQKLKALSLQEWLVLLVALIMLPVIALLLRIIGFKRTKTLLSKSIPKGSGSNHLQHAEPDQANAIARMVSVAACYGPYRANCLRQSLLLWWLLARRGLESEIQFGVRDEPEEKFGAHAWVEFNGINLSDSEIIQKNVSAFKKMQL